MNNPDFPVTPTTEWCDQIEARLTALDARLEAFDRRMALRDLQIKSALLACDAGAQSTVALAEMVDKQGEYIDALDVLWRARLTVACDRVMEAADDNQPDEGDQLQVDLWSNPTITRRIDAL